MNHQVPRDGVGPGAVGAGGHDGVEGHLLAPPAHHLVHQPGGDLPLGEAGADEVQHRLEGLVGDLLGPAHQVLLLPVLGGPQRIQQGLGGGEDAGQLLGVPPVGVHRHRPALKAHIVQTVGLQIGPGLGQVAAAGAHQGHLGPGDPLPGGLDIPAVGGVVGSAPGDQQQPLPVEPHGVPLSRLAGDEHGVQAVLGQLGGDVVQMVHSIFPPFRREIGVRR